MSEVAVLDTENKVPSVGGDTQAMMEMIQQIALNPDADVEKLRAVMNMKMEMFNRGAEIEYNAAMALAQQEMEPVVRTADNDQTDSKYARLENIIEQLSPIWTKHGFALSFGNGDATTEGAYRVECEVTHSAGHSKSYHADLPSDIAGIKGSVNKTGVHAFGSTMSYGRRYLSCMIFNIALKNEDNDGNAPSEFISIEQAGAIKRRLQMTGSDVAKFCAVLSIKNVDAMPANKYDGADKMLAQKENAVAKDASNAGS